LISIRLFGNSYKQSSNHATKKNTKHKKHTKKHKHKKHTKKNPQIMPQKKQKTTGFILFPGHLKQPYGFPVRCPDE